MKRIVLPLVLLLLASCGKEETVNESKVSRPNILFSAAIETDSMNVVHDSSTLGVADSDYFWEWYHAVYGYDIDFTRGDTCPNLIHQH